MKKSRADFLLKAYSSGMYFCNKKGEVWAGEKKAGWATRKARKLSPSMSQQSGYPMVIICMDGKRMYYPVHQCVWVYFNKPLSMGQEVNHIDCDKHNNRPGNLEATDRQGNAMHAYKNGLFKVTQNKNTGRFEGIC
jgi:hypothetical protein